MGHRDSLRASARSVHGMGHAPRAHLAFRAPFRALAASVVGAVLLLLLFQGLAPPRALAASGPASGTELEATSAQPRAADAQSGDADFGDAEDFADFGALDDAEFSEQVDAEPDLHSGGGEGFRTALWALGFTILAGILVRFRRLRSLRALFLLGSVVFLGFVSGGCPCPISSFQKVLLWLMGVEVCQHGLVWFLGLIPITYVLGRVWCGWVCHLGALQEFLHISDRFAVLRSARARRVMRGMQYTLLAVLVVQLVITRENLFIHIDPFKVAFNLSSYYTTGWILLGLILVSSLFMYRPFCRAVCPVGLVLGWISRLPGAMRLERNHNCISCRLCSTSCPTQAIERNPENGDLDFHAADCTLCGTCLDACRKDAISFSQRKKAS